MSGESYDANVLGFNERDRAEFKALMQERRLGLVCDRCMHVELHHVYSGPSPMSDDGLPIFEGCMGTGVNEHGRSDSPDFYVTPICQCHGYERKEERNEL
jgi:hypothetical protein